MKSDLQLKADVEAALAFESAVPAASVGVAVKGGIVTLSGSLESYAEKKAVESAVRRVAGVQGLALDLEVRVAPNHKRSDAEIAESALNMLHWHSMVPDGKIKVEVEDGWLTLLGELDWTYQCRNAERCVRPLIGVRGVSNKLTVKPSVAVGDMREQIAAALVRHANVEASLIDIDVSGSVVTLSGKVDSMSEHDAALLTAGAARGVSRVVDKLQVVR